MDAWSRLACLVGEVRAASLYGGGGRRARCRPRPHRAGGCRRPRRGLQRGQRPEHWRRRPRDRDHDRVERGDLAAVRHPAGLRRRSRAVELRRAGSASVDVVGTGSIAAGQSPGTLHLTSDELAGKTTYQHYEPSFYVDSQGVHADPPVGTDGNIAGSRELGDERGRPALPVRSHREVAGAADHLRPGVARELGRTVLDQRDGMSGDVLDRRRGADRGERRQDDAAVHRHDGEPARRDRR